MIELNRAGMITASHGDALALLGQRPGSAVGRSAFEVYGDSPRILRNVRRALDGESFVDHLTYRGHRWSVTHIPMRTAGDRLDGTVIVGVAVDAPQERAARLLWAPNPIESLWIAAGDCFHVRRGDALLMRREPADRVLGLEHAGLLIPHVDDAPDAPSGARRGRIGRAPLRLLP